MPRPVAALRSQQIVQDEQPLAIALADAAQLIQVEPASPNSEIIKQGATDNDIHLILSGLVSVRINGREVARRSGRQHVGEMALIGPAVARPAHPAKSPASIANDG